MYSHEIKKLLEEKKHLVNIKEYIDIVSSPQVDHIKFIGEDKFEVWTIYGEQFNIKVLKKDKK